MKTRLHLFQTRKLSKTIALKLTSISFSLLMLLSLSNCTKGNSNDTPPTTPPSDGNWHQQGTKLVGTGAVGNAFQGNAVTLSSDGNTLFFTGYDDNNSTGAAWSFTRSGATWSQLGNKLVGSEAVRNTLHLSTSISADGNTAVVGGPNYNVGQGIVWVFARSGNNWVEQAKLTVGDPLMKEYFGTSVAISADGNTIVGGGSGTGILSNGGAWVFTRTGNNWTQQGGKFYGSGAVGYPNQGTSVAISADGNTFVMSGFNDNSSTGAVWVFNRSGGVWSQQGAKLVGTGGGTYGYQGLSVSISGDGNTVAVGGPRDNINVGGTWVFTRANGTWTQQGEKLLGTGATVGAQQGNSVALSSDGNTLAVGGYLDNQGIGAVWVFNRSNGGWLQHGNKLTPTGEVGAGVFGRWVALNANGTTLAASGSSDDNYKGAVWIFTK